MRYAGALILGVVTAFGSPQQSLSQTEVPQEGVRPGQRVRVRTAALEYPARGTVVAVEEGHLILQPTEPRELRGRQLQFPWDEIERLDVSHGPKSGAGKGALIGGGIGLGLGAITAAAMPSCTGDWFEICLEGSERLSAIALLTVTGAAFGGLFGALFGGESWVEADRPRIAPAVSPDGSVGLGLHLRI